MIYLLLYQLITQIKLLLLLNISLALIQEHNLLYENLPLHVRNEKICLIIEPPLLLFLNDCIFRIDKIRKDLLFCIEYNPCVRARKLAYFGYLEVYSLRWKLPNIYLLLLHELCFLWSHDYLLSLCMCMQELQLFLQKILQEIILELMYILQSSWPKLFQELKAIVKFLW